MGEPVLMVAYRDRLHKCLLPAAEQKKITIGTQQHDTILFPSLAVALTADWDGEKLHIQDQQLKINEGRAFTAGSDPVHLYLAGEMERTVLDLSAKGSVSLGPDAHHDVQFTASKADFILFPGASGYALACVAGELYHNFTKVTEQTVLAPGDQLFFDGMRIAVYEDELEILAPAGSFNTRLASLVSTGASYHPDYPDYHRSPRIIYREPEEKRIIAKPAHKPSKPSEQLARTIVPPLVMIAALVAITIFQPRGIYILVMLSVTIVTIIFSVTSYVKNVKKYKADMKKRTESYKAYMIRKTEELHHAREEQRHALAYHYPDVETIRDKARAVDARVYEKTMFHHDFLEYRAGLGTINTSFPIEFNDEEFTQDEDELIDAARSLKGRFAQVGNVPIVTSLVKGPVGYIGPRSLVLEQLQLLVMQVSLFHSYHDVRFITIFPEEEKEQWEWMRWLPHASLPDVNVRGFVYHERSRDQVLYTLYQILKERKLAADEKENKKERTYFSPHFVVLVTDEKIILDHTIMEFFNEDTTRLGVSLVFVQDVMQSLPEHVTNVVDIRDAESGNIILEEGELVNRKFVLDHFPEGFDKEEVSRALAPLNHLQTLKNSIPEAVTFLEMYSVEKVEELGLQQRWQQNETYKSLAVPLGLRGKEDIVQLNLHEKAHGPHGLVAGTTGSGKSEIIQSYILSLAVNFHPHEVAFLLIDYKGGGMANLFRDLPHLLGTITNLDGAQSMRALASIKAELQKRQRLFGEHDVNHINQYQKLYKEGKASEAMPHLFLISDEFAELKAEQPDFMKELVSTARIGRSLGIHLILATQKPSGVVDDQIWSNSKFKLALKVQNASDSNEILKTPDAAEITLPGRAYLQVGNNEIYELFQSAWSGAAYVPDQEDQAFLDTTIYAINDLGQYDILSEDLSGLDNMVNIQKAETELDAVIRHIHEYSEQAEIKRLPRPWLPPLQDRLYVPDLSASNFREAWAQDKQPLIATIGMADIPEMQAQIPLEINLTHSGHLAVISSPGFGKSTFLQTLAMDLARKHHPGRLHMYLMDMGTNGLLPLKKLPHVADTIRVDEEIKMGKLFRRLTNELKTRKQKLSEYGVASIDMYERASKEEVPHILVFVDMFDSSIDASYKDDFDLVINQIAREGASVGIHLAISAGRLSAMRTPLLANIKRQISLYQIDPVEVRGVVGRTTLEVEEIPGRGLIKLEEPTAFQTALPVHGEDTLEIIEAIQKESADMKAAWKGTLPPAIPMVPEVIPYAAFLERKEAKDMLEQGGIPFAVDFETVEPVSLDVAKDQNNLVLGDKLDMIEQTFLTLIESTVRNEQIDTGLIDSRTSRFSSQKDSVDIYASDEASMEEMIERLGNLLEAREDAFQLMQNDSGGQATLSGFLEQVRPLVILLTDAPYTIETLSTTAQTNLAKLIGTGARIGIYFVIGAMNGTVDRLYDDLANAIKKQKTGILLSRIADQNLLDVIQRPYKEKILQPYEGYYIRQGQAEKIKIVSPL